MSVKVAINDGIIDVKKCIFCQETLWSWNQVKVQSGDSPG